MAAFQQVTPVRLGQAALSTANTLIYTVPILTAVYLKDIDIPNTSSVPVNVTVYIGPSTGPSNILIPNVQIPGNSIFQWTGTQILNAGDSVVAVASASGCNIIASGGAAV